MFSLKIAVMKEEKVKGNKPRIAVKKAHQISLIVLNPT